MVTSLFNNLSLQSVISALALSFTLLAIAVFFNDYPVSTLSLPALEIEVPGTLYRVCLLIFVPFSALWFNTILISAGFLKSHYHVLPLLALQIYIFGLNQPKPEILLALPLILLVFSRLFKMIRNGNPLYIAFDVGLLTGLMTLFYPQGAIVILFTWIALLIFGHLNLRTLIIPLTGVFAVYFVVYSAFFFLSEYDFTGYIIKNFTTMEFGFEGVLLKHFSLYLPIGIVLIPALGEYFKAVNFAKIKKRQVLNLLVIILVITFFAGSFVRDREALYVFLAFPLSILQANLIQYLKKWWLQDLVYVAVLLSFLLIVFRL